MKFFYSLVVFLIFFSFFGVNKLNACLPDFDYNYDSYLVGVENGKFVKAVNYTMKDSCAEPFYRIGKELSGKEIESFGDGFDVTGVLKLDGVYFVSFAYPTQSLLSREVVNDKNSLNKFNIKEKHSDYYSDESFRKSQQDYENVTRSKLYKNLPVYELVILKVSPFMLVIPWLFLILHIPFKTKKVRDVSGVTMNFTRYTFLRLASWFFFIGIFIIWFVLIPSNIYSNNRIQLLSVFPVYLIFWFVIYLYLKRKVQYFSIEKILFWLSLIMIFLIFTRFIVFKTGIF